MAVPWHEVTDCDDMLAIDADLDDKSSIICRAGLLLLAGGTGSWRVRDCMNKIAGVLGVTVSAAVSLTTIECTCIDGHNSFSEVVSLHTTGVNTERIQLMEEFVRDVQKRGDTLTVRAFVGAGLGNFTRRIMLDAGSRISSASARRSRSPAWST